MKVLVGCEFSGTVRDCFIAMGHDAISCDLLETEARGPHIVGDVLDVLYNPVHAWDMAICHPPAHTLRVLVCTGIKKLKEELKKRKKP